MTGNVDDQVGWSFERPDLVPVHGSGGRGSWTAWFSNVPFQPKPFYDTRKDIGIGCISQEAFKNLGNTSSL